MKKLMIIALSVACLASCLSVAKAEDSNTVTAKKPAMTKSKGEKPAASPGWLIVEEEFWRPLRFEPIRSLDEIRRNYRANEEKAAAREIDKAVSWLKLAESHAMPITKRKLTEAADSLATVAKDLRSGKVAEAAKMDHTLAKAAQALGEWHFYKAKESWGKDEAQDAGRDLEMAARYLQHAADSAHFQYGADTTKVITTLYKNGKMVSKKTHYDHNGLGKDLQSIEVAIKTLADKLKA